MISPVRSITKRAAIILIALTCAPALQQAHADAIYTVRQTFTVKELPENAQKVRGWFWMPEDRPEQHVLEFRVVEAPASFQITRDPVYGRRWLYGDASANPQKPLRIVTEFKLLRKRVSG